MKKVLIIRFGIPDFLDLDIEIIEKSAKNGSCSAVPFGAIGLMIYLETDLEIDELRSYMVELYESKKEILKSKKLDNTYPFLILDIESKDIGLHLNSINPRIDQFFKNIGMELQDTSISSKSCKMTLDELLSKISESGINSLTKEEKRRLDELSKNI